MLSAFNEGNNNNNNNNNNKKATGQVKKKEKLKTHPNCYQAGAT